MADTFSLVDAKQGLFILEARNLETVYSFVCQRFWWETILAIL